jgi:hypothetical protein
LQSNAYELRERVTGARSYVEAIVVGAIMVLFLASYALSVRGCAIKNSGNCSGELSSAHLSAYKNRAMYMEEFYAKIV